MKLNSTDIRSVKINEPKYCGTITHNATSVPAKLLDYDLTLNEGVVLYPPSNNSFWFTLEGLTLSGVTGATFGTAVSGNIIPLPVFIETNNLNKVYLRLTSQGTVGILAN